MGDVKFTNTLWFSPAREPRFEVGVEYLGLGDEQVGVANFAVFVPPKPTPILPELFQHTHLLSIYIFQALRAD